MRKVLTTVLAFTALLLFAQPGYSWDGVGHMIIAQIAYDRLTPSARVQVDRLAAALNNDPLTQQLAPDLRPYQPVTAAAWPDDIRSLGAETRSFSPWHFIDLDALTQVPSTKGTSTIPGTPIADKTEIDAVKNYTNPASDVYAQILSQSSILRDKAQPFADRARALAFVEHFVGDIHQPLHASGRLLGGNRYRIDELPGADPTWEIKNLHSFWDNAYRYSIVNDQIVVNPLLQTPRQSAPDTGEIKTLADQIVKNDLPTDSVILKQTDPAAWAVESNEIGTYFAFPSDDSHTLSNAYIGQASLIAKERLALAGIRLGNLLNNLLSNR
jgi:hypothetical protein